MRFKSFGYFFREASSSLKRNSLLALAAVSTVAVSIIIFGLSLISVVNANNIANKVESEIEISVFLNKDLDEYAVHKIGSDIKSIPGVDKVEFIPKEKALAQLKKNVNNKEDLVGALGDTNPLPDAYRVRTKSTKDVEAVALKIEDMEGVEKVRYGQEVVEKVFAVTSWIRWVGLAVMGLLGFAAVFLIATTIRLAVFARRKEIEIMKTLGATDWFIRWPFLLEGIIIGSIGAILAVILLNTTYLSFVSYAAKYLMFISFRADYQFIISLTLVLLGVGVILGAVGSMISVRRFLRV